MKLAYFARAGLFVMAALGALFGAAAPALAQMPEGTLTVSASAAPASVEQSARGTVAVKFVIADGFHIYGNSHKYTPTKVVPVATPGITFGTPVYPSATVVEEWGEKVPEYFKTTIVTVPFTVTDTAKLGARTLTLHLYYQVCNKEMCYDPVEADPLTVSLTVTGRAVELPPAAEDFEAWKKRQAAEAAAKAAAKVAADPKGAAQEEPAPPLGELPGLPGGNDPESADVEIVSITPAKDGVTLVLRATPEWHFFSFDPKVIKYGSPTRLELTGARMSAMPVEPPTKSHGEVAGYHEGTVSITVPLIYDPGATTVTGMLTLQMCDPSNCVDREYPITFAVPAGAITTGQVLDPPPADGGAASNVADAAATDTAGGDDDLRNKGLFAFLLACVAGGLFSLIMPCVYPLIPVTVTFFAKQAGNDGQGKTVGFAMAYGAGIILSFTGLGLILTAVLGATGANDFAAHPWVNICIAAVFLYLTLALFGMVPLELPHFVTARLQGGAPRKGYGGAFVLGLLFTVVTFTCVVPIAGSLMVIAAQDGSWVKATVGMLVYSTTMALPFMAFGLFPKVVRSLPLGGGWMNTVKVTGGFIELALVLYYFSKADYVWNGVENLWITRQMALSIYAATGFFGGTYLLGLWRLPGDLKSENVGVPRMLSAFVFTGLGFLMVGGLTGGDVGFLDPIVPPAPKSAAFASAGAAASGHAKEFSDWESGLAEAKQTGKPIFLEFTGGFT